MQLSQALTTLEHSGLVRRTDDFDLAYWFKHILTQETVYASLLRHDRRVLHRSLGDIYQTVFANQLDEYLLPLAYHYAEAGENDKAFKFLIRYGERAIQMSAYPEAVESFERALKLVSEADASQRAQTLVRLGDLYCRITDYGAANDQFEKALAEAQRADDSITAATALSGAARVASQQGEHAQARELGERALQAARDANNSDAAARAHRQLGISYNYEGNNALAQEHLLAALELYRMMGDNDGTSSALNSLGVVLREEHELDRAWNYFQEALELSEKRGDKYSTGVRLNNLGVLAEQRGDLRAATMYQEQAHAIAVEIGDREGAALTEINLGSLALVRGEHGHALKHFQQALAEMMALNSIPYALYAFAALAKYYVARGNFERGAELLGLAFQHPSSTADISIDFDSVLHELKAKLNAQILETAMARGRAMPLRETLGQILAETA